MCVRERERERGGGGGGRWKKENSIPDFLKLIYKYRVRSPWALHSKINYNN